MTSATPLVGASNTDHCTLQNVVWNNIKARPNNNLFDKIDNFINAFVSTIQYMSKDENCPIF